MVITQKSIPVEEQLKNAKAVIAMAAKQPVVREAIKAYAAEHLFENESAGRTANVRKQVVGPPILTGKAIESALPLLHGKFSYIDVLKRIGEQGVALKAKYPRTAVGQVLRKLCKRKIIREVQKGIAGKPSYYERLQKLDDSTH